MLEASGSDLSFRPAPIRDHDKIAKVRELLGSTEMSNRAIANEVGLSHSTVNKERQLLDAERKARGAQVPLCSCGRRRSHRGRCPFTSLEGLRTRGVKSIYLRPAEEQRSFFDLLLHGETARSLSDRFNLPLKLVERYVSKLSDDDRRKRTEGVIAAAARRRIRSAPAIRRPHSLRATDEPTYAEIIRLIGPGLPADVRDDLASDLWLSCTENRWKWADRVAVIRKARSKAYGDFAHGALSLDQEDRYGRTFLERLEAKSEDDTLEDEMTWDPEGSLHG
jgi:hypothetical protein